MHRSLLITNCENEVLMAKQRIAKSDVAFIDMEDGVSIALKEPSRARALTALKEWDYEGKERWVRINNVDSEDGLQDIMVLAEGRPDALIPGKVRSPKELIAADYLLTRREEQLGLPIGGIKLCPMIESGPAMLFLQDIVGASGRVKGLLLGAGDLGLDIGYVRTEEEHELDFVRSYMVLTAHTLGVECFDVTSVIVNDPEAVYLESKRARNLGFDGKACISPSQIDAIHKAFTPSDEEISWATKLVTAEKEALAKGVTIFGIDGTMAAPPVVKAAKRVLERAGITV